MTDRDDLLARAETQASAWGVTPAQVTHTAGSVCVFGRWRGTDVVLKVVRRSSDEWFAGSVLEAFQGAGAVRLLQHADGAALMERLVPGTALADASLGDRDATAVIAGVIGRMKPGPPPATAPPVESWCRSFERHLSAPPGGIPKTLLAAAHDTYRALCASQPAVRLLHGDLHHRNVLSDSRKGWVAIDPKGVVGEVAFEVGAALRNPSERPDIFADPLTIRERVDHFTLALKLDRGRLLQWAFAQAVLAAVWEWEDSGELSAGHGWLALAGAIRNDPASCY